MKYSMTKFSNEPMEDQQIRVSKEEMKQRIASTVLSVAPHTIQLQSWKKEDTGTAIAYQFAGSAFGDVLIGATIKGVCFMGFTTGDREKTLQDLKRRFPASSFEEKVTDFITEMIMQMNNPEKQLPVNLHLKATGFQMSIWKKLLEVPLGGLTTYAQLGGDSKIARAAGTAVGRNPICYILPCHRVIRSDGSFDGYFWGNSLKQRLLLWEDAVSAPEI